MLNDWIIVIDRDQWYAGGVNAFHVFVWVCVAVNYERSRPFGSNHSLSVTLNRAIPSIEVKRFISKPIIIEAKLNKPLNNINKQNGTYPETKEESYIVKYSIKNRDRANARVRAPPIRALRWNWNKTRKQQQKIEIKNKG